MGLGARLALIFAGVTAAAALVVGGASYVTSERQVTVEIDQFLKQRANEIANGQRDQPRDRRDRAPDTQVVVAVSPDAEVQILDDDGEVLSNTGLRLPVDDADSGLLNDDGKEVIRTISVDGTEYRMITEHLSGGGAVQVARSLDESASLLNALQTRTLIIAGVVAMLAAVAGWIVAQRTTRPLRALSDAVDEVAATRDFSHPVPASGRDEVGRLADGFNRLLASLERSQTQQRRLVQDAAHELRTPLTSVTANVDWLMRAADLDAPTRTETLVGVRRELGELNDVMAEIIELATDSHEPPESLPLDLVSVVDGAVALFVQRTGRQVVVQAAPARVVGDGDSLARAVTNLLSNAHKYSPPESVIVVDVGPDGVAVDDAGPGIPDGEHDLVFERFYRRDEHRAMPGSGLGLSIVADIVSQHGGRVHATRSERGGARVGFSLPIG